MTAKVAQRSSRWLVLLFVAIGIALIPWAAAVGIALPSEHVARHWDVAWTGFDLVLAASLLATALSAARRPEWLQRSAAVSGTLLLCDAWFDTLTASTETELWIAGLLAVGEVTLAALCFALAMQASRPLRDR